MEIQTFRRQETAELLLSIGGVVGHLQLRDIPAALLADVRRAYQAFTLPCSPKVERAFSLCISLSNDLVGPIDPDAPPVPPTVRTDATTVGISRLDFRATLTRVTRHWPRHGARFEGTAQCQATPVALESLLRVLWSVFLPRAGGALFHACGFRDQGRGILAPGASGAGKSTLARKVTRPDDLLSDEVVAIQRAPGGGWRISATPFFGELQRTAGSMQSWPLGGVAFLEKHPVLGTAPLPLGQAVMRAVACLLCFETDPETAQRNVDLVIALCSEVPTFICGSRADSPYLDMLKVLRPRLAGTGQAEPQPHNAREMISTLRANLSRSGVYAFHPQGGSMRPWLRSGDTLFIETVTNEDLRPGDVLLYWRAGRSPDVDQLVCHRLVGWRDRPQGAHIFVKGDAQSSIESFHDGRQAQVLGRVRGLSRAGKNHAMPGPLGNLAILTASMLTIPLLRLMSR